MGLIVIRASLLLLCVLAGCATRTEVPAGLTSRSFGKTAEGEEVKLYTLRNTGGMEAAITNYGGIVVSLTAPDRAGFFEDVVLGFDSLDGYLTDHPYFGAIIGRYGNRIGKAAFTLEGVEYNLAPNNGENSLHGGVHGFDKVVWTARELPPNAIELSYRSRDGEEGYPGNLDVTVRYTLTDANELRIEYAAATDKTTVLNLTNHSYFNLRGAGDGDILGHEILIAADRFTPVGPTLIPTGELRGVKGTPFDFTLPVAIGERINADDEQIRHGGGYDHNFVLNSGGELALAARVLEPESGRAMEVRTTEPGVQFYTGNFLDGSIRGKGGNAYGKRSAFCLETQHFPDSPNRPEFPSTLLKPGERYESVTAYKFTAQ